MPMYDRLLLALSLHTVDSPALHCMQVGLADAKRIHLATGC